MQNSIRVERAKLDISQEILVQKVGVSRQTIHSIERNKFNPSVLLAFKIANVFDKRLDKIFTLKDNEKIH